MLHCCKIALLYFCFVCVFPREAGAHTSHALDSLEYALDTAGTEQTRVMLRYYIGVEENIFDTGFWKGMISAARQAGATEIEIVSLDRFGFYLTMQGDLSRALVYLHKAVNTAAVSNIKNSMFAPLYHLTEVYLLQGDIKNAINYGYRTMKYAEQTGDDRNIAISYSMLGKLYSRMGYAQKALKWHLAGLRLAGKASLGADVTAVLLLGAGTDYCNMGDTANGLMYFNRCKPYIDSVVPSALQASLYNAVGMTYDINHQTTKATEYYLASFHIGASIDSKISEVTSLLLLADNAFKLNETGTAKRYAEDALSLAVSIANKIQLPRIALLLKNIYHAEGNYREALKYSEMYVLYRDSLTTENIQQQAMEREYQDEMERKEQNNRLLAKQNRIQDLVLKQKSYLTTGLLTGIVLLTVIFLMLSRQRAITAGQQKMRIEQRLLRTQMNPHFIFNALQAIQNMVLHADKKQAVKYLSSFASLTREVLENSREDMIPLSKEIALVEHYLDLQKLRFGGRFEHRIHKGAGIDDNMLIPPMIGQPFIENAVEHGMRKIETGGLIEVLYELINGMLHVQIVDNGYGISVGNMHNKRHQSMAIEITRERIEIMNKKQKLSTSFDIQDAFPAEDERKGVCVTFIFPVVLAV